MIIISARFVRAPDSLPKNDNSRMNQVEIQNDNLGPTIDQTEDMHMEKAKEISVQEATFNNYVTTHHEKRLNDLCLKSIQVMSSSNDSDNSCAAKKPT
jgi:beta-glucanase (GH16 family)